MKFIKACCITIIIGAIPLFLQAEETGVRFSIGPIYRDFGSVDFKGFGIRGANNANAPGGPFGVQSYTTLNFPDAAPRSVSVDYVNGGENDNIDTGSLWGPMLGLELDVYDYVHTLISFVSNFQFFSIQAGSDLSARNFQQDAIFNPGSGLHDLATVTPGDSGQAGLSAGTTAVADSDFDMELYVFDAGLKVSVTRLDPFRVSWAAGPTLSIGDVDTRQTESATFTRADTLATESFNKRESKSDVDFILGLYTALEAEYRLTEAFSLALGFRYDFSGVEAGTSQGEVDLETIGGYARLIFDF